MHKQSLWIWRIGGVLIVLEIIFGFLVFGLYGGVSRLAFGVDSVAELISNILVLRLITKTQIMPKHVHQPGEDSHGHEHFRDVLKQQSTTEMVGIIFLWLGMATIAWDLVIGDQAVISNPGWVQATLVGFMFVTAAMAFAKWKVSHGSGDPRLADAWQPLLCLASAGITFLSSQLNQWIPQSEVYGSLLIVVLMFVVGTMTIRTKELCC